MIKKVKVIIVVLCIMFVVVNALFYDYYFARTRGRAPIFAVSKENIKEQYTSYSGLFYKMWICSAEEENFTFGVKAPNCPKMITFDEYGYYTTINNIKISKKDYEAVRLYYGYYQINEWKNDNELKNALKISYTIGQLTWSYKSNYFTYYNEERTIIGVFSNLIERGNGDYSWEPMWGDEEYHYCIRGDSSGDNFIRSKYESGKCMDEWDYFRVDNEICRLYKKSNLFDFYKYQIKSMCSKK